MELLEGAKNVLTRARASSAAYGAALRGSDGDAMQPWLQQMADEQQQSVSLLMPHVESLLGAHKPTWLAAMVEASRTTVAQWQGRMAMLEALERSEEKLVEAYQQALAADDVPVELASLCRGQLSSAQSRLEKLHAERDHLHEEESDAPKETLAGRRGVIINTPRPTSAENSDC